MTPLPGQPPETTEPPPDEEVARSLAALGQAVVGLAGAAQARGERRRRFGRFVVVGASNALVDLAAFNLLYFAAPTRHPGRLVIYNTAAVVAAMVNGYIWHSRWTFRDRATRGGRGRWRQRGTFVAQAGLNIGINDGVLAGLAIVLNAGQVLPATVANNAAKVLAMMTASLTSYVVMKVVVFRAVPARTRG